MKERSRTKNSIINSSTSIVTSVIIVLLNFIVKTAFIRILGSEYLGVNGLFSNIITMLSLADLGIGMALPYILYKPLANKDNKKVKVLMDFYKKVYTVIGMVVILIGLSLVPFLGYIIKDSSHIANLSLIYCLFVIHSASSYFFVYKRFLIESDQKGYIVSRINLVFSVLLGIVQIAILIMFKNYIFFLLSSIFFIVTQNLWQSHVANKLYPFLKEKTTEKIGKEDIKDITKNVSALFIYKIGSVITLGTDNIVIAKFIGLVAVGIYSNYILIVTSLNNVLLQIFNAITSSVGNLVVTTDDKRSEAVYKNLNFFNFWLYSLCSVCLLVLINPFIFLWIGTKYLLDVVIIVLLVLNFYIAGMQAITASFRTAYGLFWIAKYRPLVMVIINIVASIILVQYMGIAGVVAGTILSRVLTTAWLDPYVVYKYGFKTSPKSYYKTYIYYFMTFIAASAIIYYLVSLVFINSLVMWLVTAIVVFLIYNLIFILIYRKTNEFHYFYDKIKSYLTKKRI